MKKNTTPSLDLRGDETSLLLLLFLYTLQGIPIGLAGSLPFLLQERGTSLTQQSMFSIASYPFSFKVLWAPILDAVFLKRFGRRKSWLVPVQILTGVAMIVGSSWLPVALDAEKPDVAGLTAYFFSLYFMMATQDIAVDGWALTMLSKRNVGLASTCNTVGQTIGYFSAYTGFLSLYSMGYVTLSSFVLYSGYAFLVATSLLLLKKEREDDDVSENLLNAYRDTIEIVKLKPVRTYVLTILTVRVLTGAESVVPLKLIEYGVPKESLAMLAALMTPVSILIPSLVSKWVVGSRPLDIYLTGYKARFVCVLIGAFVVHLVSTHHSLNAESGIPMWLYAVMFAASIFSTAVSAVCFTAQMAFHNRVAQNMTSLGGTYMTLLNTFANLGAMWPSTLALYFTEVTTLRSEDDVYLDGYFVVVTLCVVMGLLWLSFVSDSFRSLQLVPHREWAISKRH